MDVSKKNLVRILRYQREEVTGSLLYEYMAKNESHLDNKSILVSMADQEKDHAVFFGEYTGVKAKPFWVKMVVYMLLSRLLGYTFVLKLMERDEALTVKGYSELNAEFPEIAEVLAQEESHERSLAEMLDEERLHYIGAMVLGLNDALVELSGILAGLTLALGNNRLVALAGIVTGMAATLSMAASNYLAERAKGKMDAMKSSVYTGAAYLVTVCLLVLPYLLFPSGMYILALCAMLVVVVFVIAFFNYYVSVAKDEPFWPRFREMAVISLGVAAISFCIGLIAKFALGVDI